MGDNNLRYPCSAPLGAAARVRRPSRSPAIENDSVRCSGRYKSPLGLLGQSDYGHSSVAMGGEVRNVEMLEVEMQGRRQASVMRQRRLQQKRLRMEGVEGVALRQSLVDNR